MKRQQRGLLLLTILSLQSAPGLAFVSLSQQVRTLQSPKTIRHLAHSSQSGTDHDNQHASNAEEASSSSMSSPRRRDLFSAATTTTLGLLGWSDPAGAVLVQFPCDNLKNRYHFMRAGQSELEDEDIYSTNPLFLTNRENQMTAAAQKSIIAACRKLRESGNLPTVAYHSLAANGMDTGDLLARELKLGRDRLLPEFTYLDQRGIGLWDSTRYSTTRPAIATLDATEGGAFGNGGRPPANTDGTPNETLGDQFVRLRQFLSLQESRTSGENILIIFPDGTGPALLSCMIAGLPLGDCHCLDYEPGEIRLDITLESVTKMYEERRQDPAYLALLEEGKDHLAALRQATADSSSEEKQFVNLKDRIAEERRLEIDQSFEREKQMQREAARQKQEELLRLRQEEEQRVREERLEQQRKKRMEKQQALVNKEQASMTATSKEGSPENSQAVAEESTAKNADWTSLVLSALAVTGAGAGAVFLNEAEGIDEDNNATLSAVDEPHNVSAMSMAVPQVPLTANATAVSEPSRVTLYMEKEGEESKSLYDNVPEPRSANETLYANGNGSTVSVKDVNAAATTTGKSSVEEEVESLEKAQQLFQASLMQLDEKEETDGVLTTSSKLGSSSSTDAIQKELNFLEESQVAMGGYLDPADDDGSDDWLKVLAEIRSEDDD